MTRITNLKARTFVAFVTIASLLIALQPTITYACSVGSSGHCGG